MKRSAAPSLTKSATSKKQKQSVSTEQLRKVAPASKMTKTKVQSLSAKQLKAFHSLLSAASYISVLEDSQMGIKSN
jgi:hypothetical protein